MAATTWLPLPFFPAVRTDKADLATGQSSAYCFPTPDTTTFLCSSENQPQETKRDGKRLRPFRSVSNSADDPIEIPFAGVPLLGPLVNNDALYDEFCDPR